MLYREIIAVYSEVHIKHINESVNVKPRSVHHSYRPFKVLKKCKSLKSFTGKKFGKTSCKFQSNNNLINHKFYVHSTHCIYVFCVDLRTNSHYFPIQH